jgi:hypothetical protein
MRRNGRGAPTAAVRRGTCNRKGSSPQPICDPTSLGLPLRKGRPSVSTTGEFAYGNFSRSARDILAERSRLTSHAAQHPHLGDYPPIHSSLQSVRAGLKSAAIRALLILNICGSRWPNCAPVHHRHSLLSTMHLACYECRRICRFPSVGCGNFYKPASWNCRPYAVRLRWSMGENLADLAVRHLGAANPSRLYTSNPNPILQCCRVYGTVFSCARHMLPLAEEIEGLGPNHAVPLGVFRVGFLNATFRARSVYLAKDFNEKARLSG